MKYGENDMLTITPNLQTKYFNFNNQNNKPVIRNNKFETDTISFTSGVDKTVNKSVRTFKDIIGEAYEANMSTYKSMGTKLLDTLEALANKYKKQGISFCRSYCEKGNVKQKDSFFSKFIRAGELPLDRIRSTLFDENLYDFKFFTENILPDLESRGYKIYMAPSEQAGRKVLSRQPKVKFRLNNIPDDEVKKLPPNLRKCIKHAQSSGYEDIELYIVDSNLPKKRQIPMEILMVFGKNYAAAKHDESYYVYDIIRSLTGVLHVSQIRNPDKKSYAGRIANDANLISEILTNNISKPLFANAKNKDYYHSSIKLPIELSDSTSTVLQGLFQNIRTNLTQHYKKQLSMISSKEYDKEIRKLLSELDGSVTTKEIKEKRIELKTQVQTHKEEDLKLLEEINTRLNETIEKYGKTKEQK